MSQIMIALVSEQRMQNIIPIFQKGKSFKRLWLVRSTDADVPDSRFSQAWRNTVDALGHIEVITAEQSVGAYEIAETQQVVTEIIARESTSETVINFTGGTKCMSVGAYLAARAAGTLALYVDTANEKLVWFPGDQIREESFDLVGRLTVPVYLQANGKRVDQDRTDKYALPANAFGAARELVKAWPECLNVLEECGRVISQAKNLISDETLDNQVGTVLAQYDLVRRMNGGWTTTPHGRSFLTGKWLDVMVHVLLEGSGYFDDVKSNLRLQGVENELDVLVTRNGQLAVLECKSGDLGGQTTLNKLQAIKSGVGTFARSFFVTSRELHEVDNPFRERAKEYGIREIISKQTLLDAPQIVKEKMRGTP